MTLTAFQKEVVVPKAVFKISNNHFSLPSTDRPQVPALFYGDTVVNKICVVVTWVSMQLSLPNMNFLSFFLYYLFIFNHWKSLVFEAISSHSLEDYND